MESKVWFSNLKLSYKQKRQILRQIDVDKLFNIYCIKNDQIEELKNYNIYLEDKQILQKTKNDIIYMKKYNINIMFFSDHIYPKQLLDLDEFPLYLYYIGDIKALNNKYISIIGSRNYTIYGQKVAKDFAKTIVENGYGVVSGFAKGIDSIAQKQCIDSGGKTIGIIGSGLDNFYPKQSIQIARQTIKKGGLILTEYGLGTPPYKYNFPWRNRIIAAIGEKMLVVEAKQRSGTMITTNYALDLGRDVYVVPNDIYSQNSQGTNKLIFDGANIALSPKDIL